MNRNSIISFCVGCVCCFCCCFLLWGSPNNPLSPTSPNSLAEVDCTTVCSQIQANYNQVVADYDNCMHDNLSLTQELERCCTGDSAGNETTPNIIYQDSDNTITQDPTTGQTLINNQMQVTQEVVDRITNR